MSEHLIIAGDRYHGNLAFWTLTIGINPDAFSDFVEGQKFLGLLVEPGDIEYSHIKLLKPVVIVMLRPIHDQGRLNHEETFDGLRAWFSDHYGNIAPAPISAPLFIEDEVISRMVAGTVVHFSGPSGGSVLGDHMAGPIAESGDWRCLATLTLAFNRTESVTRKRIMTLAQNNTSLDDIIYKEIPDVFK